MLLFATMIKKAIPFLVQPFREEKIDRVLSHYDIDEFTRYDNNLFRSFPVEPFC